MTLGGVKNVSKQTGYDRYPLRSTAKPQNHNLSIGISYSTELITYSRDVCLILLFCFLKKVTALIVRCMQLFSLNFPRKSIMW